MATYEIAASTTLSSPATSITFSAVPSSSYESFVLVLYAAGDSTTTQSLRLRYNGDTGTSYSETRYANNASSITASGTSMRLMSNDYVNYNGWTMARISIPFPWRTDQYKTALMEYWGDAGGTNQVGLAIGTWKNTSAITSITVFPAANNWYAGTTCVLYGV